MDNFALEQQNWCLTYPNSGSPSEAPGKSLQASKKDSVLVRTR